MAEQESVARKQSRSKRDKQQDAGSGTGKNGHEDEVARYEQELAAYLQERIKPGLNSGAIPLLARSIAKDIAHREHPNGTPENAQPEDEAKAEAEGKSSAESDDKPSGESDDEQSGEADDEPSGESDDEPSGESDDERSGEADDEPSAETEDEESAESEAPPDFEADMRELQAELGEDWILRFSVQGDDGWLTAEKDDGSQRVEAPEASVLLEAVGLLNERGGRSA
jgi:hypothetical protein